MSIANLEHFSHLFLLFLLLNLNRLRFAGLELRLISNYHENTGKSKKFEYKVRHIGYASLSKMYPHLYFLHNKIWMSNSRSLDNYIQGLHERCLRSEAFKLSKIICSRQIYFCQHLFCTVAIKVSKRYCTRNIPGHFLKSHKSHRTSEKTSVFNAAEIIFFHQILLDTTFSIKAVVQRYSEKNSVLTNFAKFTGKHLAQVFSCEFYEIFTSTFFYRTPPVATSVSTKVVFNYFFFKKTNKKTTKYSQRAAQIQSSANLLQQSSFN